MIAEHTFVTTLPAPDAFAGADRYLTLLGFAADQPAHTDGPDTAAAPAASPTWSRGPRKPTYSPLFRKLQMSTRIDFDRGRITAALSIQHPRKVHPFARPFALDLLAGLERALTSAIPIEEASRPALQDADRARRRDFRRRVIIGLVVIPLFILSLILVIGAASTYL